jgi:hypothetical protein
VQCFGHRAEIGLGKPPNEGREIANYDGIAEARRRQGETGSTQLIPSDEGNPQDGPPVVTRPGITSERAQPHFRRHHTST